MDIIRTGIANRTHEALRHNSFLKHGEQMREELRERPVKEIPHQNERSSGRERRRRRRRRTILDNFFFLVRSSCAEKSPGTRPPDMCISLMLMSLLSLLGRIPVVQISMLSSSWRGGLGSVQKPIKKFRPWTNGPRLCGPRTAMGLNFSWVTAN